VAEILEDALYAKWGSRILQLALGTDRSRILTRRIDTVECVDASTIRRRVECHINLTSLTSVLGTTRQPPAESAASPIVGDAEVDSYYLPLTRQVRPVADTEVKQNTTFTVVDENGSPLPRLTKSEERELVLSGVLMLAQNVLGRPTLRRTRGLLTNLVTGDYVTPGLLEKMLDPPDRELLDHAEFMAVAKEAYERYFMIVVLPSDGLRRRVLSYSYDQQPTREAHPLLTRFILRLKRGVLPRTGEVLDVAAPSVADCLSYHLEFIAPDDLAIPADDTVMAIEKENENPLSVVDDDPSTRRAHFYYEGAHRSDKVAVRVRLMLAKTGLSYSMDAAAIVACLLLIHIVTLSWWGPDDAFIDVEAWVTILLAAPAVATAIIAIRSVHRMTSRLSRDKRITVALPAFTLFCAAVVLLMPPPQSVLGYLRTGSLVVAVLSLWRCAYSWWSTRWLGPEAR
jgi:hypothetical protein